MSRKVGCTAVLVYFKYADICQFVRSLPAVFFFFFGGGPSMCLR